MADIWTRTLYTVQEAANIKEDTVEEVLEVKAMEAAQKPSSFVEVKEGMEKVFQVYLEA